LPTITDDKYFCHRLEFSYEKGRLMAADDADDKNSLSSLICLEAARP
jgi:hypothetical protein